MDRVEDRMRVGCVCVTEGRAPIFGIALSSFFVQRGDVVLAVIIRNPMEEESYRRVYRGMSKETDQIVWIEAFDGDVPARLDHGCDLLFNKFKCDIVTMWDDDDYAPPDRMDITREAFQKDIWFTGYNQGYFVNLRTLHGQRIKTPWGYWGGSITLTRDAWDANKFNKFTMPGYDRCFADLIPDDKKGAPLKSEQLPVAFSHGKNVTTWLKGKGEPMEEKLEKWMPSLVFDEVKRVQKFLIDRRVYPPGS
jgi:hypothetical protein